MTRGKLTITYDARRPTSSRHWPLTVTFEREEKSFGAMLDQAPVEGGRLQWDPLVVCLRHYRRTLKARDARIDCWPVQRSGAKAPTRAQIEKMLESVLETGLSVTIALPESLRPAQSAQQGGLFPAAPGAGRDPAASVAASEPSERRIPARPGEQE